MKIRSRKQPYTFPATLKIDAPDCPLLEGIGATENPGGSIYGRVCLKCGAQVPDLLSAVTAHSDWHTRMDGTSADARL